MDLPVHARLRNLLVPAVKRKKHTQNSKTKMGRDYYYEEPAYVIAGGSILPFFAIVVTALRLRIRIQQRQPLKADDWLVLPATVRVNSGAISHLFANKNQIFAVAIGILMIYSVSQHALAYPLEIPADFDGNPLLLVTPQIVLAAKACNSVLKIKDIPDLTFSSRHKSPFC